MFKLDYSNELAIWKPFFGIDMPKNKMAPRSREQLQKYEKSLDHYEKMNDMRLSEYLSYVSDMINCAKRNFCDLVRLYDRECADFENWAKDMEEQANGIVKTCKNKEEAFEVANGFFSILIGARNSMNTYNELVKKVRGQK